MPWLAPVMVMLMLTSALGARVAAASDADARARAAAAIEAARDAEHRARFTIRLPASPSGLPARYEITHHAAYVSLARSNLVVRVTRGPNGADGEMVSSEGVFRGPLPVAEVDAFARFAFYLLGAAQVSRDPAAGLGLSGSFASHVPYRTLAIIGAPGFSLKTGPAQPIVTTLEAHDDVQALAHATVTLAFEKLARERLGAHPVAMDGALLDELRTRFRSTPDDRRAPLGDGMRDDRDAALARLIAYHLEHHGRRTDVAMLRARGFEMEANALALSTASGDELTRLLRSELCAPAYERHATALARAADVGPAARLPLRHALRCEHHESITVALIRQLGAIGPNQDDLAALASLLASERTDLVRVAAAGVLAQHHHDTARAMAWLLKQAWLPPGERMSDAQSEALSALERLSAGDEPRRIALAGEVAELLSQIPLDAHATYSGMNMLVAMLGRLYPAPHRAAVERILDHSDASVVVTAIDVIAQFDRARAIDAMRRRIARYAAGDDDTSYGWDVQPYLDDLARWRAVRARPELERALPRLRGERYAGEGWLAAHLAALKVLR